MTELLHDLADILCRANNAIRGPDMLSPIEGDVKAVGRSFSLDALKSGLLEEFKDGNLEGKTIRMLSADVFKFGGAMINPETFQPTGEVTEITYRGIVRFGVE